MNEIVISALGVVFPIGLWWYISRTFIFGVIVIDRCEPQTVFAQSCLFLTITGEIISMNGYGTFVARAKIIQQSFCKNKA